MMRKILSLMLVLSATLLMAETVTPSPDIYVKKDSWSATMLAMRDRYQVLLSDAPLRFSPWSATAALKAKGFADVLFPEQGVDLAAKDDKGQPVWKLHTEWADGVEHHLSAPDSSATYLFRTISVKADTTITAGFGSDDGMEVWLNNKKLHSVNVGRGVTPNQDKVSLALVAGDNRLLVKIFNNGGNCGFYFNAGIMPTVDVWPLLVKDFPVQAAWLKRDTEGRLTDWLGCTLSVAADKTLITRSLSALGQQGVLHQEMAKLEQDNVPAIDPRWLDLYLRACQVREIKADVGRLNTASLRRAIEDLSSTYKDKYPRAPEFLKRLDALDEKIADLRLTLDRGELINLKLLEDALALQRDALLANPLMNIERLLLVKRNLLGLPQNWQGNTSIGRHGYDAQISVLSPVRPEGKLTPLFKPKEAVFVGDMDLDFDGTRMLFSMPGKAAWQVWQIKADGSDLRQLTPDIPKIDNYDACYLPDGKIMFNSTMNIHGVPCVGGGDKVGNLCRMDADGKNVRMLCFEQDQDWYPRVLSDGRVMYTRWEYSDIPHYHSRLLMSMNPDGTGQLSLYGSNSYWPNSIFYARQIPDAPSKVIAVISGHHGVPRMGELVLFDLARGRTEANGAVQRIPGYGKKVEPVIADGLVEGSWPKFLHPYPLSEKYFIVSCKPRPESHWGIYLVDIFDNMLCLAEEEGYELFEPIPFQPRVKPPAIPDRARPEMKEGIVNLSDVYAGPGLKGVQKGTVKALRVYSFHFGYWGVGGHANIGVDGSWDGRRIIGTVPVYEDGSANFKVPANTPIAIQALNERGEAVALMRSWFVVMPGENASCVGCHESVNSSPLTKPSLAMRRAPSAITPWNGPERPFSFRREVQPVLDKSCVGCHDGTKPDSPDFRGNRKGPGNFDASYLALMPFVRRPGPESDFHVLTPMDYHVSTSELFQMLRKGHHNVALDAEAWSRLTTWVDLNVPCHGTWGEHRGSPMGEPDALRNEYRKLYANTTDNPETYPTPEPQPVAFVKPEPVTPRNAPAVTVDGWPFDRAEAQRRQAAAGLPKELQLACGTNSNVKLDFVLIPAGEFVLGNATGADDEYPPTRVRIAKPFYMSRKEISNAQFREFDAAHDSRTIDTYTKDHTGAGPSVNAAEQPVVRVTWQEAVAFCDWFGRTSGQRCALPTEAQWEYACRAGTATPLWFGDLTADFGSFANLADKNLRNGLRTVRPWIPAIETVNDGATITQNVSAYQPNPWGLYSMHGNAAEWTRSLYQPYPYRDDDGRNAISKKSMGQRIVRGGSFWDRPYRATSSARRTYEPWQRVFDVGFRIILEPDAAVAAATK
jgi:formylglycine-generating enzyme required for sulfatase activity